MRAVGAAGLCTVLVCASACGAAFHAAEPASRTDSVLAGGRGPDAPFRASTAIRLERNSILVPVAFDGDARTLVLDSGAPMTISEGLAERLALASDGSTTLLGPDGGRARARIVEIPSVRVAGRRFSRIGAVVAWDATASPLACLSRDGLLGASLLHTAIWQIDFHAGRLTVTDRLEDLEGLEDSMPIPFRRSDAAGSPRIEVGVGKADAASLLIDLGFNGSVEIPVATYGATGSRLEDDTPAERGRSSSTVVAGADRPIHLGRLNELRIGGLRLHDFPVVTGSGVSDFHVGVAFLRHFRVTIDWLHDQLYLQRRDPEGSLYETFPSYGFTPALHEGALVVAAIWDPGPAESAGLEVGDAIVAIDGRPTTQLDPGAFCRLLDAVALYGSKKEPITVTIRRGHDEKTVTVERKPLLPTRSG